MTVQPWTISGTVANDATQPTKAAFMRLTQAGLTPTAAAAVVGNFIAESGDPINPNAVQKGGPGRGIAQWSVGARWEQLKQWAVNQNRNYQALDTQLDFAIHEMKTMKAPGGKTVWDALNASPSVIDASAVMVKYYEMPADQSDAAIQRRAKLGVDATSGVANMNTPGVVSGLENAYSSVTNAGSVVMDKVKNLAVPAGIGAIAVIGVILGIVLLIVSTKSFKNVASAAVEHAPIP